MNLGKTIADIFYTASTKSLLNEIRQIVHSIYQAKQFSKKVCINILKFIVRSLKTHTSMTQESYLHLFEISHSINY